MRHFFIQLFFFVTLIPSIAQEYNIELEIKGAENLDAQFAYYESDKQFVVQKGKFDEKGKLIFKDKRKLHHGLYYIVVGKDFFDLLIRDNQSFKLKSDISNLVMSMQVFGSKENQIFFDYQKDVFRLKLKIDKLEQKLKQFEENNDSISIYKTKIEKLDSQLIETSDKLKKEYPNSYIVKILKAMSISDIDKFDFADDELLFTPFYYNMIRLFIKKNIQKNYKYINIETKKLLNQIRHQKLNYQFVATYLLNFYNTFYQVGINNVFIFIADNYFLPDKADWLNKEQLKQIKERRDFLAQSTVGQTAQDLTLESISGEYFSLLQTEAKLTFLYFWSADCGHCTKTTNILKDNYEKLTKNGVQIFAVNIDKDRKKWIEKLNELQTEWINCFDPNEESGYRDKYYVYGSPLLYVIDSNKKIIDVLDGQFEIETMVKKIISE